MVIDNEIENVGCMVYCLLLVCLKPNFNLAPYKFTVFSYITQYMHKRIRLPYTTHIFSMQKITVRLEKICSFK